MKSLFILGRQPLLGLAELESLYGPDRITPILSSGAATVDIKTSEVAFDRPGGSIKLAEIVDSLPSTNWREVADQLDRVVTKLLSDIPDGKLKLGLSTYGIRVSARDLSATALNLKKSIKSSGRSVRVVPNKFPALNSAQVIHNQLTGPTGIELVLVRSGNQTIIARTIAEQDIEAYARRDQDRPKRDAKVGMLPPKLAQIIINLSRPEPNATVLDPFCGTGVLLQEALLMGFQAYGTDLEPRMVEYSTANLDWLLPKLSKRLEVGDATTHKWGNFDVVAAETFLGKPLTSLPPREILDKIMDECDQIHNKFLSNIATQLKPGSRLCLAVPAWRTKNGFLHLKTLDRLAYLGYTRMSFVHTSDSELVYHRPDQTVARELVVLTKN